MIYFHPTEIVDNICNRCSPLLFLSIQRCENCLEHVLHSSLLRHLLHLGPQLWHHILEVFLRKLRLQSQIRRPVLLSLFPAPRKHVHKGRLSRLLNLWPWPLMYFVFCYVEQLARDYADEPGGCWMHLVLAFLVRKEYVLKPTIAPYNSESLHFTRSKRGVYICLL